MINVGDVLEDSVVHVKWATYDGNGASVSPSVAGNIRIYKNNETTEKTTTNGITDTRGHDTLTGIHHIRIDTSDDTGDVGFWETGQDYFVVLVGATIDGQSVNAPLAMFSIENQTAQSPNNNADALLKRDFSSISGEAARSVLNALRKLRNKISVSGGTLTVTKEDDSTTAWTAAVTSDAAADPITEIDPT